jgi:hypothetical protein
MLFWSTSLFGLPVIRSVARGDFDGLLFPGRHARVNVEKLDGIGVGNVLGRGARSHEIASRVFREAGEARLLHHDLGT